jgi:hypothetical protein
LKEAARKLNAGGSMTRNAIAWSLSVVVAIAACSRPATKDEALGAYAMNKGKAHDTLIVYPNGAYARRYKAPGAAIVVDSGHWTWDSNKTEHVLTFENFIPRWNDELYPPTRATPAIWRTRPERRLGGAIKIPVEGDLGWAYVRVSPSFKPTSYRGSPVQDVAEAKKLDCNRPLGRTGIPVRGIVTASDSSRFWVAEVVSGGMPARQFVYTSPRCLPVESSSGRRFPLSSLMRGQAVVVWMRELTIPTQPIQAVAEGVQLYEVAPPPIELK